MITLLAGQVPDCTDPYHVEPIIANSIVWPVVILIVGILLLVALKIG